MTIDEQRMREQFEAHFHSLGHSELLTRHPDGFYSTASVRNEWRGFQDGYRARDAEVQALKKQVDHAKRIFQNAEVRSGYCVCGEIPEHHSADCGYTDQGQWEAELWLKRAALAGGEEGEAE